MTPTSSPAADDRGAPSLPGTSAVTVKRTFPGRPDQVARVREFVRLVLGPVPVVDEAVLLTFELAANAVIHTASGHGGTFDVVVSRYPSAVRVEVHDAGSHQMPTCWGNDRKIIPCISRVPQGHPGPTAPAKIAFHSYPGRSCAR